MNDNKDVLNYLIEKLNNIMSKIQINNKIYFIWFIPSSTHITLKYNINDNDSCILLGCLLSILKTYNDFHICLFIDVNINEEREKFLNNLLEIFNNRCSLIKYDNKKEIEYFQWNSTESCIITSINNLAELSNPVYIYLIPTLNCLNSYLFKEIIIYQIIDNYTIFHSILLSSIIEQYIILPNNIMNYSKLCYLCKILNRNNIIFYGILYTENNNIYLSLINPNLEYVYSYFNSFESNIQQDLIKGNKLDYSILQLYEKVKYPNPTVYIILLI